ncbi:4-hydroxyphenylacetate 3-monooxygenase, oxygenase component [Radiobacillus sp. PE A8.2]|uniref:4-hydroxyphenylacetate 3-monooxygenase, oxygenase component n=1 Tax=Radiobacillus sp. PE A8.2 TaxID=3380349 RepID=UPI00388DB98E
MTAKSGIDYVNRIDNMQSEIWIDGKKITGKISEHAAFKGIISSQAALYDLQHEQSLSDVMTYVSPTTKDKIGTSFLQPRTISDLHKRRNMIQHWAKKSAGMMGRSPDYMNTVLMAFASSAEFLRGKKNCFPDNLIEFYEHAREEDLSFTHTFINPQINRSQFYFEDSDQPPIAARRVDTTDEGIVVKGARLLATQGGITDEILVLSPGGVSDSTSAFFFSIPSNTKGLKFICRESFMAGDSKFNYPLSSRFEEMDTIVVFDNVVVPWDRVFYYDNIEVANKFKNHSAFLPFTLHQVVSRQIIKTEFVLGVTQSIVDTINSSEYQHVQQKLAEIIMALETMKALLTASETDAQVDEFGLMRPNVTPLQVASAYFPKVYPRLTEIVQLLATSGIITIPTEEDFESELQSDLELYLQAATRKAKDRVKLFRLAWDLTMSAFGTRQTQYERFFFGDPIRLSSELYHSYDKTNYTKWIDQLLK